MRRCVRQLPEVEDTLVRRQGELQRKMEELGSPVIAPADAIMMNIEAADADQGQDGQHGLATDQLNKALANQRAALGEGHPSTAAPAAFLHLADHVRGQVKPLLRQSHLAHACK